MENCGSNPPQSEFGVPRSGESCMENGSAVLSVKDDRKFEVECNAGDAGELRVGTESLSVSVGQRVRRDGSEEMWHSVLIHCDAGEDGSLSIKVMVCHFDWEETRQIALIQSKPNENGNESRALTFDFEHKDV
jgi:hypothetical protein